MNQNIKSLNVTKIVTHEGSCHMDDLLSVAICSYIYPKATIERRKVTEQDLESKSIIVIDIGKKYEPEKLNFDHHQMRVNKDDPEENKCALDLIWAFLGYGRKEASLCPWLTTTTLMDCVGSKSTAAYLGLHPAQSNYLIGFSQNPIFKYVSKLFQEKQILKPNNTEDEFIISVLQGIGKEIVDTIESTQLKLNEISKHAQFKRVGNIYVLECLEFAGGSLMQVWLQRERKKNLKRKIRIDLIISKSEKRKVGYGFFDPHSGNKSISLKNYKKFKEGQKKGEIPYVQYCHKSNHYMSTVKLNREELDEAILIVTKEDYRKTI